MVDEVRSIKKKPLPDDTVDAIVAFLIIAITVTGVVYWLAGMPS